MRETKSYYKSIISILTVSFFIAAYILIATLLITRGRLDQPNTLITVDEAAWEVNALILYGSLLSSICALLFGGSYLSQVRPSEQKQGVVIGLMIVLVLANVIYFVSSRSSQG